MSFDQEEFKRSLVSAAQLARVDLTPDQIEIELLPAPHRRPSSLPSGRQAVYCFLLGERCLKVGKAGPKTQARFTSQHYGSNAPSTLAMSIIKDRSPMRTFVGRATLAEFETLHLESVGGWLEKNTARLYVFLPATVPTCALAFVEAFLQCWLRPVYEGKAS